MRPFGDRAALFPVPSAIDIRRALLGRLQGTAGVQDVVICEEVGCVVFEEGADRALIAEALSAPVPPAAGRTATHVVRVVYDGEDLDEIATAIGKSRDEVVRLHTGGEYQVAMLGFLPGFAYLRGLAPALSLPRRAPRPRVTPLSVAIAAEYTGIYPVASAGGWHLLGRSLELPRLALGDRVQFSSHAGPAMEAAAKATVPMGTAEGAHLVVTRLAGLALFVDAGRAGQMFRGMPPGGPLVRAAFEGANALAENDAGACALELTGQLEVEARGGTMTVATSTHGEPRRLREGERLALASAGARVAYLAVAGGFDAPLIEGSRNALLVAGIGGPLRRGDALPVAPRVHDRSKEPRTTWAYPVEMDGAVELRPGPDAGDELRAAIEAATFAISPTSDRMGTRLTGPALPSAPAAGRRTSRPMVEGAIELTPSGLVVLGPDHPTTGGYPVPAVVAASSRDAFFSRPLGASVRFRFG